MRLLALALCLAAGTARATTLLVPEFSDPSDPAEGSRARSEILRVVGAYPGVEIAPLFRFKRLAKRHHLNSRQLSTAHAAAVLGRSEGLDGLLAGSLLTRDGRRLVRLVLFDQSGTPAFTGDVGLSGGEVIPAEAAAAGRGIAAALGLPPIGAPAPAAPAQAAEGAPPVEAAQPPVDSSRYPPADQSSIVPVAPEPIGGPIFDASLSLRFTWRSFDLIDTHTSTTLLHFGTATPYLGIGGGFSLFPFRAAAPALQCLGLIGGASIGFVNSTYTDASGNSTSFGSTDLRVNLDLTYRLKLPAFSEAAAIYNPSLAAKVGYALFDFSVDPQNPADLQTVSRSALELGLDYLQPVARWMQLDFGADFFVAPTPGAAEEAVYGSSQSSGFGRGATASGSFGAAFAPGLGYRLALDYFAFSDRYAGNGSNGPGINRGDESYVDLWLGLTYAF